MKRNIILASILICASLFLSVSCATVELGQVGELPNEWWIKERGALENLMRSNSTGYYANILAFLGHSDYKANYSASMAIEAAKLNAKTELSEYISTKAIGAIEKSIESILAESYSSGNVDTESQEKLTRNVLDITNKFESAISITQFSSFIIEAKHTEKFENGLTYYKAWVLGTIQDFIIEEIILLQKEAFKSVSDATEAYTEVMMSIQEKMSKKLEETFLSDFNKEN